MGEAAVEDDHVLLPLLPTPTTLPVAGSSDLRVLIVTATYLILDGVSLTIRKLEHHLRSIGAAVMVVTTAGAGQSVPEHLVVAPGASLPWATDKYGYQLGTGLDKHVTAAIERFDPNVVHLTVPDILGLDCIQWAKRRRVCTWHSNYEDFAKSTRFGLLCACCIRGLLTSYLKFFYNQVPLTLVPAPFMLRRLRQAQVVPASAQVWGGRGVDTSVFHPSKRSDRFREAHGFGSQQVVLLWAGRAVSETRPAIWAEVYSRLREEGAPVAGLVIGQGNAVGVMAQLEGVRYLEWLEGHELAVAMASSELVLIPHTSSPAHTALECLASGTPAIVEAVSCGHVVTDDVTGHTAEEGSVEQFYYKTRLLVNQPQRRAEMAAAGVAEAANRSIGVSAEKLVEHYNNQRVLQGKVSEQLAMVPMLDSLIIQLVHWLMPLILWLLMTAARVAMLMHVLYGWLGGALCFGLWCWRGMRGKLKSDHDDDEDDVVVIYNREA